jgi:hypothetical protein
MSVKGERRLAGRNNRPLIVPTSRQTAQASHGLEANPLFAEPLTIAPFITGAHADC